MQQPPPTTTLFPYTTLFRSFPKKNEAENEGKRKRRIRQDAQRHMQRKNDTAHRGRRKPVRRSQMRSQKEHQDKRQNKSPDGSLAVVQLQPQVRQRQKPAEQGHGAIQVVVRNRVRPARPF